MLKFKNLILIISLILISRLFSVAQISADFTVDNSTSEYCSGDTVKFTNTSTGVFETTHWDFGDCIDTWGDNPTHIYLTDGEFTVWMKITSSTGEKDSSSMVITIYPSPVIELINDEAAQSLTVDAGITDVEYKWYFGISLTDETNNIIYYLETGNYAVVAFNDFCSDSASVYINLDSIVNEEKPEIVVKNNILTPDLQDGANDVLFIDNLGSYTHPVEISVYNKWGQLVYENSEYTNLGGFSGTDNNGKKLDAGTYYYIIKSEGRKGGTGFIDIIR